VWEDIKIKRKLKIAGSIKELSSFLKSASMKLKLGSFDH
jgi:hypothetical protein